MCLDFDCRQVQAESRNSVPGWENELLQAEWRNLHAAGVHSVQVNWH